MMKRIFCILTVITLLSLGFVFSAWAEEAESTVIRVFHTTDIHGYLMSTSSTDESTFQYRMARLAKIVNDARSSDDYDGVLLLNGGNNYEGTPVSNLLQGSAIRAAFDVMGYDAVSIGNHEFDYGIDTVNCDPDGTVGAYAVGGISGDPLVPVLAYNLYYAGTTERVAFAKDYVVAEKGGRRIALIGYISDFSSQVMVSRISPYEIDDSLEHLADKVHEVNEKEQPDATVIVAFGSASRIAESMNPDEVQLVTGGHSMASTGSAGIADNGVAYMESACYVQGYVSASLVFRGDQVTVEDLSAEALAGRGADPSMLSGAPENESNLDPDILAISRAAWNAVKDDMSEELGVISTPIDKTKTGDNGATYAGNWITGLMLRGTQDLGTVAAFYNEGGIRTSLTIPEGETERVITAGDVYTINPFCNYWYVYELTGPELAQQLVNGFRNGNFGDQVSGLTFTYIQIGEPAQKDGPGGPGGAPGGAPAGGAPGQDAGDDVEYTIVSITLSDGTEVDLTDPETTYRVCTSNYSGTLSGGVFETKESLIPASEAPIDNITIIELLRREAAENNGRISVDTTPRGTRIQADAE